MLTASQSAMASTIPITPKRSRRFKGDEADDDGEGDPVLACALTALIKASTQQ
jgi:hypothetical protein